MIDSGVCMKISNFEIVSNKQLCIILLVNILTVNSTNHQFANISKRLHRHFCYRVHMQCVVSQPTMLLCRLFELLMTDSKVSVMVWTSSLVKSPIEVEIFISTDTVSSGFYTQGREGTNNMSTTTVQREGMESHTLQSC